METIVEENEDETTQITCDIDESSKLKLTSTVAPRLVCTFENGNGTTELVWETFKLVGTSYVVERNRYPKFKIDLSNDVAKVLKANGDAKPKLFYISTVKPEPVSSTKYATDFKVLVMHLTNGTAHLFHLGQQRELNKTRYIGYVETEFTTLMNISIDIATRETWVTTTSIHPVIVSV